MIYIYIYIYMKEDMQEVLHYDYFIYYQYI
jgi:hypothetical protein